MTGCGMTAPAELHVLIVDDEPLARQGLRDAIERLAVPGVSRVDASENAVQALDAIRTRRPDILLLDVAMPVLDGFGMLEQLEPETSPPAVIFVTAYDEHAVRAFSAAAIDYLVKPVSDQRLRIALDRAARRVTEARALRAGLPSAEQPMETPYVQHLIIPERGGKLVVPVDEVEWIEGDTYYVRIHARGRTRLLRERLSRLEAVLDPALFHRTHRSAIVRLDLIRQLNTDSPYSWSATLANGDRVPVSRERLKELERRLAR
jgi:two-component system LytT family response regulator